MMDGVTGACIRIIIMQMKQEINSIWIFPEYAGQMPVSWKMGDYSLIAL